MAIEQLLASGSVFPCACTRKEIADSQTRCLTPTDELVYPCTCRNAPPSGRSPRAIRVRAGSGTIEFDDELQGRIRQNLLRNIGDFVVRRADGLFAYQLAVVVDDTEAWARISSGARTCSGPRRARFTCNACSNTPFRVTHTSRWR